MEVLSTSSSCLRTKYCHLPNLHPSFPLFDKEKDRLCGNSATSNSYRYGGNLKVFASQNQTRNLRRRGKLLNKNKNLSSGQEQLSDDNVDDCLDISSSGESNSIIVQDESETNSDVEASVIAPSRAAVLQACTLTSGLIGGVGVLLREVSHVASRGGWPVTDCSKDITFDFEFWHLELIAGSVILVSTCRFLLLKTWPNFQESSEAANRQILTSLEPLDYSVVAFLPGISEEFLFRGALLPLLGVNWLSILVVAGLFGVLHLGSGRKYSFAIWATFVGLVYGYATMVSSSVVVPMASHALNNLVGGIVWRYTSNSSKKIV